MSTLYKNLILSKTNLPVPLFNSGKSMHSRYDPEKEASGFGLESNAGNFIIICGLGAGYHVKSFIERNPCKTILVIENSFEDYSWLKDNIPAVRMLSENKKIFFAYLDDVDSILSVLINNYVPSFHGNISVLQNRNWIQEIPEAVKIISETINRAVNVIGKDYSVQAHFGRIWQKNIFTNLKLLEKLNSSNQGNFSSIDTKKTASIIAAGPTLDSSIKKILCNPEKYFVIGTDTGNRILEKYNIVPDAIVSIDAQIISSNHFISRLNQKTLYIMDLCSDNSICKALYSKNCHIVFADTGHPLSQAASIQTGNRLLTLNSGSGTVTIAAVDFARKAGFKNIEILGADFSYRNNKPYAKGTYLEELYRRNENRYATGERKFTDLLFRTEISRPVPDVITNSVMNSYRDGLINWFNNNDIKWKYEDNIYTCSSNRESSFKSEQIHFSYKEYMHKLTSALKKLVSDTEPVLSDEIKCILPYIAYLRRIKSFENYNLSQLLKLAYDKVLEYN